MDFTPVLPMPCRAFRTENRLKSFAIDDHLESPRTILLLSGCYLFGFFPGSSPIPSSCPHMINAGTLDFEPSASIRYRITQPVSHKKGRTHLVHKLLIYHPAPQVVKVLCFNEYHSE